MKEKILITGAEGFIGSHLVEYLLEKNFRIKALVMYNSFNSWGWLDSIDAKIKKSIEVVSGDIRDPFFVDSVIQDCDAVIHLAALIAIPFSYQSPSSYINTNINGTLNVLQAAKNNRIKKVIHTSTSEVYGSAQYVPIDENHPLEGQSPYSASKIGADQIAMSFFRSFNTPVAILRPFNTYGPRQSARAIIPTIISQIAAVNDNAKNANTDSEYSMINGPPGVVTMIYPAPEQDLSTASAKYSLYGKVSQNLFGDGNTYDYIDTTIYVVGKTTGVQVQIPVRIIRKVV